MNQGYSRNSGEGPPVTEALKQTDQRHQAKNILWAGLIGQKGVSCDTLQLLMSLRSIRCEKDGGILLIIGGGGSFGGCCRVKGGDRGTGR